MKRSVQVFVVTLTLLIVSSPAFAASDVRDPGPSIGDRIERRISGVLRRLVRIILPQDGVQPPQP